MSALNTLSLNALVALHNAAVDDYAPEGFAVVERFKSKAYGIERIAKLCEAGSLAVEFNGEEAVIVDAMEAAPVEVEAADDAAIDYDATVNADADAPEGWNVIEGGADGTSLEVSGDDDASADDAEDDADDVDAYGDRKGAVAPSGFVRASDDWLKSNARGSDEREAYRKARRKAARTARKAARSAKEAALNEAVTVSA